MMVWRTNGQNEKVDIPTHNLLRMPFFRGRKSYTMLWKADMLKTLVSGEDPERVNLESREGLHISYPGFMPT